MTQQTPNNPGNQQPQRYTRPKPTQPRRVSGGVRLAGREGPLIRTWVGRRWTRVIEDAAVSEELTKGVEYARIGQTRELGLEPGAVLARVQGCEARARSVRLECDTFTHEQWELVFRALAEQPAYTAKLLAGEMPVNIEDLFAPMGLRLFPQEPEDIKAVCDCDEEAPWCRHACCAATLFSERIDTDPYLIFTLRGLPAEELSERLRQHRALAGSTLGAAPAYAPRPVSGADLALAKLPVDVETFWSTGPELDLLEMPMKRPEVSHPLLRRLGPSPFEARFPMVGLLATCYDVISEAAIRAEDEAEAAPIEADWDDVGGGDDETDERPD
ncbi:MAG: hypothetical protein EA376_09755 [Phycisphaeraceae bacterium]|nr:MAG: hypothetical protein EA376_09755 [Phycisphaeraceae bacterium]